MKITKKNYFPEVRRIGFENLPEALKKIHLVLMTKTDQGKDWTLYEKDKEFKKTIDLAFEKLTEFIKNNRKDLSGIAERNALIDGTFKAHQSLDGTDNPDLEKKLILRLLNMTGKIISKRELKNYIDDLQEAIRTKKIRKTSKNADEIAYIQTSLVRIYNGMKRNIVVLQFKKDTSKRLKTIALKTRKKSHKTGKKTKTIKQVSLKGIPEKPVLNRVESKEKQVTPMADKHLMSSVDFAEMKFESLGFSQKWRDLMGDPSKGFTAMVYGKPKTGKSYLSVDFAGYLARHHGNTLYVAKEEKLDATLHKKLQDKEVVHQNLFVSDFLPEDLSKYEFIFIDSVNKLGLSPQDIENLRTKNPGKSFIFIFQTTKQGQFRGRNEFQHDVDIVIEVPERGKAVQFGRFNQGGEMDIFEETQEGKNNITPEHLMGIEPEKNLINGDDLSGKKKEEEIIKIEAELAIPLEELAIEYFGNKAESHPAIVNTLDNHSSKIIPVIERILKKGKIKNHATLEKIQFSEMDSANLSHGAAYFKVILKGSPDSLRKIAGEDKLIFYEWEK